MKQKEYKKTCSCLFKVITAKVKEEEKRTLYW